MEKAKLEKLIFTLNQLEADPDLMMYGWGESGRTRSQTGNFIQMEINNLGGSAWDRIEELLPSKEDYFTLYE